MSQKNEDKNKRRDFDKLLVFISVVLISVIGVFMLMAEQAEISNYPEEQAQVNALIETEHLVSAAEDDAIIQKSKIPDESEKININSATKTELMFLDGVGEKRAESIISYREKTPFRETKDIMNVKGIGQKTYEKNKDKICVK